MRELLDDQIRKMQSLVNQKPELVSHTSLQSINSFEHDIKKLQDIDLDDAENDAFAQLIDQAATIEAEFENIHPQLSATMGEIIRMLGAMGI